MKNLVSKNQNASCYINIILKTTVHVSYDKANNGQYEKMFIDHGLLNLRPEPLSGEQIASEIESLEQLKHKSEEANERYNQLIDVFKVLEFTSETLGLFIDNFDCLVKHVETVFTDEQKIAKFVVVNDISIGSILSENFLTDSVKDYQGNTTSDKLQIILGKLLTCSLPNPDTFSEENISVKLLPSVTSVTLAKDNKFIKFADQMKNI